MVIGGGGGREEKNNNNNHYTYLIFSCLNVNKLSPSLVSISSTEMCNKYSVTVIFLLYFIQVYNHNFSKHSKLNSCSILMKFLPTGRQKRELCNFL